MSKMPSNKLGPRSIGQATNRLLRPTFRKRGFAQGDVLTRWKDIVGPELAQATAPERLSFPAGSGPGPATLTIRVAPGFAPALQHLEPMVLERINMFYGYRAVGRIKLIQAPLQIKNLTQVVTQPITPAAEARIQALIAPIKDADLRAALERLARSLASQSH